VRREDVHKGNGWRGLSWTPMQLRNLHLLGLSLTLYQYVFEPRPLCLFAKYIVNF
jgi:hypothetical protein